MTEQKTNSFDRVTVKQLLESGVHFGHQTRRWNPKMAEYIFTDRNGVYIIDLEKTVKLLASTCAFLRDLAKKGGTILFVGTKRQAQVPIREAAEKTGMPYVNERWLGGMLTNFETIRKSVSRLEQLETMEAEGTYQFLTKKEVSTIRKDREKLMDVLAGVRHMKRLPDALFVIDPSQEAIAVAEARRLEIPVAALIDTNCDPDKIDYLIPGNDDAIRSVKLICEIVAEAIREGREQFNISHGEETSVSTKVEESVTEETIEQVVSPDEIKIEEVPEDLAEKIAEKVVVKINEVDVEKPKAKKAKPPRKKEE